MKRFIRNTAVMAGGAAGSQLLLVIATPIITRLYTPQDFGVLAIYIGILALFCVIASFRYEMAIPIPERDEEAIDLVFLSLILVGFTALISCLLIGIWGESIAFFLQEPRLKGLFWLLPLGVLFVGTYQILNKYAIREKLFKSVAVTRINQSITILIIQLLGYKLGAMALILAQSIGQGAGAFTLSKGIVSRLKSSNRRRIISVAKKYRRFPLYSSWAGLLNTSGAQLPPLAFASLFSSQVAGYYTLAFGLVTAPITLLASAVGNVFLSDAAKTWREGSLGTTISFVHNKLANMAMPVIITLIFVIPDIFAWVFGERWATAGLFAQWMLPWIYLVFVTAPLSTTYEVIGKQSEYLIFQFTLFIVRLCAILYGAYLNDLKYTIVLFSLSSALCWLFFLLRLYALIGLRIRDTAIVTIKAFRVGIFCAAPCLLGVILNAEMKILLGLIIISLIICGINAFFTMRAAVRG
ncbi:oligosaccharide flippase family protein [Acinetobacter sp. 1000160]|uniref:oligosaccharide flippase family protein n=1 Tax=Acinetobacter sp. 1000160 TaxID=1310800 RepID=UPI00051973EB|nr:oligosaccharide flippase family protein [Acinetobacter sp. 1000160]